MINRTDILKCDFLLVNNPRRKNSEDYIYDHLESRSLTPEYPPLDKNY